MRARVLLRVQAHRAARVRVAGRVDDLAGGVHAVVVTEAVGDPADLARPCFRREGPLQVSRGGVGVDPAGAVHGLVVGGETEDAGLAGVRARVRAVLDRLRECPGRVDRAGRLVQCHGSAHRQVAVDLREAPGGDDVLPRGVHDHRVDLEVGLRRPAQQGSVGGVEAGEVLTGGAVALREQPAHVDAGAGGCEGVDTAAADRRVEAGHELAGHGIEGREVPAGLTVDGVERSADVDAAAVRRRGDGLDHTVHLRREREQLTRVDVVGEHVGAGRQARSRRGERGPGVVELADRIDGRPDHRLRPDVAVVDLHRRNRIRGDDVVVTLQQRRWGRGDVC